MSGPSESNVARYRGHVNSINCMQVIDDATDAGENLKTTYIFTGGYDHTARCFNAETGECLFVYRGHRSFVFSLRVAVETEEAEEAKGIKGHSRWFMYTGSYDGTVRRWDVATGQCVKEYELEYGDENPRFRAGIVLLVEVCEHLFFTVTSDKVLRAWRIKDGEMAWDSHDHKDNITGMQLRKKSEKASIHELVELPAELFTCSADKTVRVWEPQTGSCKRVLRFDTQPLYAMFVQTDGQLFVGAGSTILHCDSESGEGIRSFTCHTGAVKALWGEDGRVYAGTGMVSVQFNVKTGQRERVLGGHSSVITCLQLHDKTLYTTGDDCVCTWDTEPLLFCCMDGNLKLLRVLLSGTNDEEPADVEMKTGSGNSALLLAAKAGHSDIIESLLMYSADVQRMSRAGETALHCAALAGIEQGVLVLLKAGANPNFSTPSQDISMDSKNQLVVNKKIAAYGEVDGDQTPLHYAAKAGSAPCCKLLIENFADSNFKDSYFRTPVHIAAMVGASSALETLLYTRCRDPNLGVTFEADFTVKDMTGMTALKLAKDWECKRLIWKRYMERWANKSIALKALGVKLEIPPMEDKWSRKRG